MIIRSAVFTRAVKWTFTVLLLSSSILHGQEQNDPKPRIINPGDTISDSLQSGQNHRFSLTLQPDTFVFGQVLQSSVDVVIAIADPKGAALGNFDRIAKGMEPFYFDAKTAGVYIIEVKPFKDKSGEYAIELLRREPVAADPAARVDQLLLPYDSDQTPGAAVAVMKDGKVIFSKAFGMANLSYDIPFTTETLTNIGSTSKQFTAFAIALLAQQNTLSIDDDVRDYIPELPDFGKKVTIRNLLTHTSGYREYLNALALAGRRILEGDIINREEIIKIVQRQPELQNDPGAEWNYNNTGFSLAATLVERVTEQKFPEWMRENVFEPLGMMNTLVRPHPRTIIANASLGYNTESGGGYTEARDLSSAMGAGGIYSTLGDLAKWINNLHTAQFGGEKIITEMTSPFILTDGDSTNYGLGLFIDTYRGLRRIHHGGADVAHRSMLAYYPEINAAVITQSNNASFSLALAPKIADAFFDEHLEPEPDAGPASADSSVTKYDPEKFDELAGRYELESAQGLILNFTREGDDLFVQVTGQPKLAITSTSDSTFRIVGVDASVTFHRTQDNKVESLTLHQRIDQKARRITDKLWQPVVSDLTTYTGRYYSEELETYYALAIEDSNLVVKHRRASNPWMLTPVKVDTFSGTFPIVQIAFDRDTSGQIVGLKASNGRTRGVVFSKWK